MSEHESSGAAGMSSREREGDRSERREFFRRGASWAMAGSLAASYGTFGVMAVRYLLPADPEASLAWQFVARIADLPLGKAFEFTSAAGEKIVVTRQREGETADAFQALSSVCPHLGCRVHWEPNRKRFFCPCHNGVFDPQGVATAGPPAKAGQRLTSYPIHIVDGLVFVKARRARLGA